MIGNFTMSSILLYRYTFGDIYFLVDTDTNNIEDY